VDSTNSEQRDEALLCHDERERERERGVSVFRQRELLYQRPAIVIAVGCDVTASFQLISPLQTLMQLKLNKIIVKVLNWSVSC